MILRTCGRTSHPAGTSFTSSFPAEAMDAHVDLLTELQLLDKVPTLERLRAAQKRRAQQLKKWAQYEKEMQHKKRKHEKKRNAVNQKKVSFEASVALLEASLRNDLEEGRMLVSGNLFFWLPAEVHVAPRRAEASALTSMDKTTLGMC